MIYRPFSVVVVPFPFTDSAKKKKRPALVVSSETFQQKNGHAILLMMTSAKHSKWYGDFLVKDLKSTKLPVESYIRQKVFTMDLRLIQRKLGALSKKDISLVKKHLKKSISI